MQLFEACLAPNTAGDGTGCDNMTAVIIQFQSAMLDRCCTDANTEDVATANKKRPLSPSKSLDSTDSIKKLKTDSDPVEIGQIVAEILPTESIGKEQNKDSDNEYKLSKIPDNAANDKLEAQVKSVV